MFKGVRDCKGVGGKTSAEGVYQEVPDAKASCVPRAIMTHEISWDRFHSKWSCECGSEGYSDEGVRRHLAVMKQSEELSAVEKAIERNYEVNR